jgi:uncharacterized membrane protein YoaK (UPF0700 family)
VYRNRLDQYPNRRAILHWFLLAFNAGCVNAGGFMMGGRFVTHVTGSATMFGVDLSGQDAALAMLMLSLIVFFLLGSMTAGLLIDREIHFGRPPHYDFVMGLCSICLSAGAFIGNWGRGDSFGTFGSLGRRLPFGQQSILLALLCMASGLQNGALTSSSGSSVRTTHMSGLTTDLGLGFARMLTFRPRDDEYRRERVANILRVGTLLSFIVGAEIGAMIFILLGLRGFLIPAAISAYAAWHGRLFKLAAHRQDGFSLRDVPKLN